MKDFDYESIHSVNHLYLIIDKVDGYIENTLKKIKFNSDNNLPLKEILKLHNLTINVKPVFQEDNKNYQQIFLDECLYELEKCYNMKELMFQKELAFEISQTNA